MLPACIRFLLQGDTGKQDIKARSTQVFAITVPDLDPEYLRDLDPWKLISLDLDNPLYLGMEG